MTAESTRAYSWYALGLVTIVSLLNYLDRTRNSLSIWGPTFFTRAHGYSIKTLGIVAGLTSLTFGIAGTLFGGVLADRLRRFGPGGRMWLGVVSSLLAIPFWIILLFSSSVPWLLLAQAVLLAFSL